ncbi:hypothetical protein ACH41E_29670 [Streptomyces sp. NPDC020412]|uniref:hypothetical protein n=1 Tax=Streptomyces sp. NPDC020412 TaxID=3365073 RepID=UPI003796D201
MNRATQKAWVSAAAATVLLAGVGAAEPTPLKNPVHHTHHGEPVLIKAGTVGTASVTCPKGTVPTGGGGMTFSNPAPDHLDKNWLIASYAEGSTWYTSLANAEKVDVDLVASVICNSSPHSQFFGEWVKMNKPSQVDCPTGMVASGGGFQSSGSGAASLTDTRPNGNGWMAQISSYGQVRSFVLCSTEPHQVTEEKPWDNQPEYWQLTAQCDTGQLTGGGARLKHPVEAMIPDYSNDKGFSVYSKIFIDKEKKEREGGVLAAYAVCTVPFVGD